jgi:hypothetical protein
MLGYNEDCAFTLEPPKTIHHERVQKSMKELVENGGDTSELAFVIRPGIRISDTTRLYLRAENIEVYRDEAAPIEGYYIMDRKTYRKYE